MSERVSGDLQSATNYSLLSPHKPFNAQFWSFALPYALYVAGNAMQPWLGRTGASCLGGLAATAALAYFWQQGAYRFRPTSIASAQAANLAKWKTIAWSLALGLLATVIWIAAYRYAYNLMHGLKPTEATVSPYSLGYLLARGLGSSLVIPIAEELLFRVYLLESLRERFASGKNLEDVVNAPPPALTEPPTRGLGIWVVALLFTLGHPMAGWPAALIWFGLTMVLYRITRSLPAVIFAHALANALIAFLVGYMGWNWLW